MGTHVQGFRSFIRYLHRQWKLHNNSILWQVYELKDQIGVQQKSAVIEEKLYVMLSFTTLLIQMFPERYFHLKISSKEVVWEAQMDLKQTRSWQ